MRMNAKIIIGIVLIVVGMVLAIILLPMTTKTADEIQKDYDWKTGKFKSYKVGDTVKIRGTIKSENEVEGIYLYELKDSNVTIGSKIDLGNKGDKIGETYQ